MTSLRLTAAVNLQAAAGKPRRFKILAYSGGKLNVDGFQLPVVAQKIGVSRPTLYNWKNKLLGREVPRLRNATAVRRDIPNWARLRIESLLPSLRYRLCGSSATNTF